MNGSQVSHTISFTVPDGSIVKDFWYRQKLTTPTGACDALSDAGYVEGHNKMNGETNNWASLSGGTIYPGTSYDPSIGSHAYGHTNGVLFPGDYDFETLITHSYLKPACWGTVVETQVFMETEEVSS